MAEMDDVDQFLKEMEATDKGIVQSEQKEPTAADIAIMVEMGYNADIATVATNELSSKNVPTAAVDLIQ